MALNNRIIVIISVLAAFAFFAAKSSRSAEDGSGSPNSVGLSAECEEDQFSPEGKRYRNG